MNLRTHNLCLLGFGNVGRALARLLLDKRESLRAQHAIDWRITGVASRRIGWLANPSGLDPEQLLALPVNPNPRAVGALLRADPGADGGGAAAPLQPRQNVREWLRAARAGILFEMSSLNRHTGQPAIDHLQAALACGAHAISAKSTIVNQQSKIP